MKTLILASLLISLTSAALGQDLAITHATVYASPEAPARRDVTVVIRHGLITSVGEHYLADLPPDFKAKLGQPATPREAAAFVDVNRSAGTDIVKLFTGSIVAPNHITPMKVDIARAAVHEAHRYGQLVFSHSLTYSLTHRRRRRALTRPS